MYRRQFSISVLSLAAGSVVFLPRGARSQSLGELAPAQLTQGLRLALERGAGLAVDLLGQPGGFWNNPQVRIALPPSLDKAAKLLRKLGQSRRIDELQQAMNQAAEQAVPQSRDLLIGAVRSMSVTDAKTLLTGGDTSVTQFFAEKTRQALSDRLLPVVTQATERVELAEKYNQIARKAVGMGLLKEDESRIETYVTGKTLDGLYFMVAEQEKKIRQDPVGTGSALLQKVFGALK